MQDVIRPIGLLHRCVNNRRFIDDDYDAIMMLVAIGKKICQSQSVYNRFRVWLICPSLFAYRLACAVQDGGSLVRRITSPKVMKRKYSVSCGRVLLRRNTAPTYTKSAKSQLNCVAYKARAIRPRNQLELRKFLGVRCPEREFGLRFEVHEPCLWCVKSSAARATAGLLLNVTLPILSDL